MCEWWAGLTSVNRWFYISVAFFSVLFFWQLIMDLIGVEPEADSDLEVDAAGHVELECVGGAEAPETLSAFKLMVIRSIVAFFTLFSWAGALYLNNGIDMFWRCCTRSCGASLRQPR